MYTLPRPSHRGSQEFGPLRPWHFGCAAAAPGDGALEVLALLVAGAAAFDGVDDAAATPGAGGGGAGG